MASSRTGPSQRGKRYSLTDALRIIADSDSDLSDSEFSLNDDTEDQLDDNSRSANDSIIYDWQDYPDIDPWEASWIPDFTKRRGVLVDTTDFDPHDYFKLFFPDSIFELMSNETNRYAERFFDSPAEFEAHSRFHQWKPTTKDEMKGFVALQIEMGMNWRYDYKLHWSTRDVSPGGFGRVMSRDRFVLLQSFVHFCDNEKQVDRGQAGYNPLFKVQQLLDLTLPTYQLCYQPGRDLSIDESMVKYKGRLFFRQYMPAKPTKYGIKDFVLAEANTGYCLNVITYTGKDTFSRQDCPLTSQVVLQLLDGFDNAGHIVYMDNFYSSPDLFVQLQRKGIGACGTACINRRNMPQQLKPENLKLKCGDDPIFMRSDNIVAVAWQDVKRVTCLSTVHTNNTCDKIIRQKGNPAGRMLDKPVLVEEYNAKMGGVDQLDQMLVSYAYPHKSTKWYHAMYHRVQEIALTNGFIIYKQDHPDSRMTAAQFREAVVDGLRAEYVPVQLPRRGRPSKDEPPKRLTERHFPVVYDDKKYKPDCEVCSNRLEHRRHQCNTYCKQCQKPMHATGCFERYHTLKDYRMK